MLELFTTPASIRTENIRKSRPRTLTVDGDAARRSQMQKIQGTGSCRNAIATSGRQWSSITHRQNPSFNLSQGGLGRRQKRTEKSAKTGKVRDPHPRGD
jgi:hypothetical protein